jgi:hypothetical protein
VGLSLAEVSSKKLWWKPTLADFLFAALTLWLVAFSLSGGGIGLLEDSGTGYHIRTGDWVLEHHAVPRQDIFSFTKPGEPWYAWEWLASAIFAALFRWGSMKAVLLFSAATLAVTMVILARHMIRRGANALVTLFLIHLAIGACSIHFLARPHIFTMLFAAISMRLLDSDREHPSRAVWWLVPLTALWANMHGGFVAVIMSTTLFGLGCGIEAWLGEKSLAAVKAPLLRYGTITLACLAASFLNPYGFREHQHIIEFLRQKWILDLIEEYQSPRFHSTVVLYYEILLFLGLLVSGWLLSRKKFADALVILLWAHFSLVSVRHIPIFAIVALPPIAVELTALWNTIAKASERRSTLGILSQLAADHAGGLARTTIWTPAILAVLLFVPLGISWPQDFPDASYPVTFVTRHANLLEGARVFSTDRLSDYLTFRFYPRQRIFIDGRGDFFGEKFSHDYLNTLNGGTGWEQTLNRYQIDVVLVPSPSGLASLLRDRRDWIEREDDSITALFERAPAPSVSLRFSTTSR